MSQVEIDHILHDDGYEICTGNAEIKVFNL
jgi:hypothetical protein